MIRYLFYTIGDLTYQSPLVKHVVHYSTNKLQTAIDCYTPTNALSIQ